MRTSTSASTSSAPQHCTAQAHESESESNSESLSNSSSAKISGHNSASISACKARGETTPAALALKEISAALLACRLAASSFAVKFHGGSDKWVDSTSVAVSDWASAFSSSQPCSALQSSPMKNCTQPWGIATVLCCFVIMGTCSCLCTGRGTISSAF